MKHNQIINLTKEEFINELYRKGSRTEKSPTMWTINWLKANNKPYKKFNPQNWVYAETHELVSIAHESDIKNCIDWINKYD